MCSQSHDRTVECFKVSHEHQELLHFFSGSFRAVLANSCNRMRLCDRKKNPFVQRKAHLIVFSHRWNVNSKSSQYFKKNPKRKRIWWIFWFYTKISANNKNNYNDNNNSNNNNSSSSNNHNNITNKDFHIYLLYSQMKQRGLCCVRWKLVELFTCTASCVS